MRKDRICICPGGDKLLFINLENYDIISERGEISFIGYDFHIVMKTSKDFKRMDFVISLGDSLHTISTDTKGIDNIIVLWNYAGQQNTW